MNNIVENLNQLYAMKRELKAKRKAYNESVRGLVNGIHSLESEVVKQVLESGKTVTVGGIRAEYKPTVVIKMKKEGTENE